MKLSACMAFVLVFVGVHLLWMHPPWIGSMGERDPWEVRDQQGRLRLRVAEHSDGTFLLAFLRPDGSQSMSLGTDALGSPVVELNDDGVALRLAKAPGGKKALGISIAGGRHATHIADDGMYVATRKGNPLILLHVNKSRQAECIVMAEEDRGVSIYSNGIEAGLRVGEIGQLMGEASADAGMFVNDYMQSLWLGKHSGGPSFAQASDPAQPGDPTQSSIGMHLSNIEGSGAFLRLVASEGATPVVIQASQSPLPSVQIGCQAGGSGIMLESPRDGVPRIQGVDRDLRTLWSVPGK